MREGTKKRIPSLDSVRRMAACFFSVLFTVPYLQHNLYHTTLFSGFGAQQFVVFALFSLIFAAGLIGCIVGCERIGRILRPLSVAAAASVVATDGTVMLWFAPSVGSDAALIWGALGAGCYALGLVALGARMFLMLGVLARREGLKAVLALVVLAALCGHVAFAYSAPAPFYAFIAVAGLSLSGIAQLCFGLLAVPASAAADGGEVPSPCDADLYGNGWRFFYVIFFATVLVHGLLYVADPALEYLGDAPLSRGVTFLLLLALSVLMLATSSKASRYLRAVCLFGNGLFAVLFLGLVAVSFSSLTHGDFSAAAGVVLALIPRPEVVFLDELTTGLDVKARRDVWNLLDEMRQQGMTIVLTSHFMDEVEALCDRVIILRKGRIVFEGTVAEAVASGPFASFEDAYLAYAEPAEHAESVEAAEPAATAHFSEGGAHESL